MAGASSSCGPRPCRRPAVAPARRATPIYDPFWARAADAGVVVAFHSGDAGYGRYIDDWEPTGDFKAFQFSPLRGMTSDRAPFDLFAVLTCHGVFHRHPGVKVASIEAGADWVAPLVKKLKKAYAQSPLSFQGDPVRQLQDHLWVAPFYEDDIRALADAIGVEHVLFGSDFPHAEGLADPLAFVKRPGRVLRGGGQADHARQRPRTAERLTGAEGLRG